MRELQKGGKPVVVVDGGNLFFSKPQLKEVERPQLTLKASKIVEACNALGLDALGVGPLDFADGFESLLRLHKEGKFPAVCSNLLWKETGRPVFKSRALVRKGGVTVGFVGALDPSFKPESLGPQGLKMRLEPVYQAIEREARELKAEGADLVVLLSALDPKKIRVLAKNVRAVDLLLGGDPGDKLMIPYRVNAALVVGGSQLGKYVGHVEADCGKGRPPSLKHAFVPMKLDRAEEPVVKRIVDGYYRAVAKYRREGSGMYVKENEEAVNLARNNPVYASAAECKGCHRAQYDRWRQSPHARAFEVLPVAARHQMECVECHVTGFGRWGGFDVSNASADLKGVQCEECHGPGSLHPAMPGILAGEAAQQACRRCHTRSRSPDFKLREYLARLGCAVSAR